MAKSIELSGSHDERPTVAEIRGEHKFAKIAGAWTLNSRLNPAVVTEVWQALELEGFHYKSLLVLENLRFLEDYLWPHFTEDSSNNYVLLIALMVSVKSRENLAIWDAFSDERFSILFRRVLNLALSMSTESGSPLALRIPQLLFVTIAFRSLDNALVRKECAPLVSILLWHHLHTDEARALKFEQPQLRKAWKAANKRFENAEAEAKPYMGLQRSWLHSMIQDFIRRIYFSEGNDYENTLYCERFMEFLIDLESQLPTRRYVNSLLHDLNLLTLVQRSKLYDDEGSALFRDLYALLRHYMHFPIDDFTGAQLSQAESYEIHCAGLAKLQRTALKHFREKLTILALSNYGAIDDPLELKSQLSSLTDSELERLLELLGFRTTYPEEFHVAADRAFMLDVILEAYGQRKSFQESVQNLSILPTEDVLFEPTLLRNETYNGSTPLAIPKLNLQYLTTGDFLWRSFILYRLEAFFEIRKDVEDVLKRLQPRISDGAVRFDGFSRMALPAKPNILDVAPPVVGQDHAASVRAEVILDLNKLGDHVRHEWNSLKPNDVIFLLSVSSPGQTNGTIKASEAIGLKHLRAAEIVQTLDHDGRPVKDRGTVHRLLVNIDPVAYKNDTSGKDIYKDMNLIMRRTGRENNFKPILESIRDLTLSSVPIPTWLQDVFLGYGDPAGASYNNLPNRLESLDFRDTFLEWNHLVQSFPGKVVEPREDVDSTFPPPYVLEFNQAELESSKKRRRDEDEPRTVDAVKVSTYHQPNMGPYVTDAPKQNTIRFTPAQVEAIHSGTQPGLTVIVGPPGTGKTDVAVQIINNLYHGFPEQRTLLVTHSNQALNQLFQKIVALDIDDRHLLRLGHGEDELETEGDFSKYGRVESFLSNRARYLAEVDKLAASLEAPGAHGGSCETAGYFNSVYVKPLWAKYEATFDKKNLVEDFPFYGYFSDVELFPADATHTQVLEIVSGCYRHIEKIFTELEDIRPFELLRSHRDQANYLLIKEARIIAMTSTHAAMRRQEIASLGFHYHNLVMEEAAQVTEIETFIPFALQNVKDGELPLERVVLCGDHQQNSPIISNLAFRRFANLEQSLFLRLVRLGVPIIQLDQQGRARPSIAQLYSWRYDKLDNLPLVDSPDFQRANAGLAFDYQFINVSDYKGIGESEPTPHWIQNLGEAEYVVALYQYMRLLGYPADKISILTPYAGQRSLIKDVLSHRCGKNRLFGQPKTVTTVDRYQGEQNDYVLLSLTRTKRVGYLRDIRRMTVALSRARLGLYIFGRREVFESCFELKEAFEKILERPDKLQLVTNELFPCNRLASDLPTTTEMEGVEHLGQYVFQMTEAQLARIKGGSTES